MGHDLAVATRILTWNLQGRRRPDLDVVAGVIADLAPDVVALQEVQRAQARALARRLGWSVEWRFKHWPLVVPPEGLALLTPAPPGEVARVHLAHRFRFWSWRRRIALAAAVAGPDGPVAVVGAHLGAGVGDEERSRQAALTVAALGARSSGGIGGCVAGDLNTRPGSAVLDAYATAGLRDAWADARPGEPGPTGWPRRRDVPPSQRLDYVLVTGDLDVVAADLPSASEPGFDRFPALSDHLPLTVTVAARGGRRR